MIERIIGLDDNPANAYILSRHLKNEYEPFDYEIVITQNYPDFISTYFKYLEDTKIVLMDIAMPLISGIQIARIIRAHNNDVPIIAVTATDTEECREAAKKANINEFVTKPYSYNKLIDMINRYLFLGGEHV